METDRPAPLENRKRGAPKRDEAILAEWKPKARVSDDLERELAVAPGVRPLVLWWAPQRNATEHKGAGLVGKFLVAVCSVLTNEADGVLSKNSICLRVRQLATKVWCTEEVIASRVVGCSSASYPAVAPLV